MTEQTNRVSSVEALAERAALVQLLRLKSLKRAEVPSLVEEAGSATAVLKSRLTPELTLFQESDPYEDSVREAENEIVRWERDSGLSVLSVLDEDYPANLRMVYDRPAILFVQGNLEPQDERSVAIVGTRSASDDALVEARRAAVRCVEADYTVLSGLARGVDSTAHRGAIEAGGRTIAVIGTGLNHSYPKENADLQREIAERFAVISQFWPDQPPTKYTFPMRNAVMSGLAKATLVIEASGTSGAKMQARLALEHGRPVFLMRRLLKHDWARQYAQREGTHIIDDAAEMIDQLENIEAESEAMLA